MRMGMATDHGGWPVQEALLRQRRAAGHAVVDFGAHRLREDDDYPDYVVPLARAVAALEVERGVAICGSGVGASVRANKVQGIRAALIHDHFSDQPSPGTSSRHFWPPRSVRLSDTCGAWATWLP